VTLERLRQANPRRLREPIASPALDDERIDPRLALRLARLRQAAPFGGLVWTDVQVEGGRQAVLTLVDGGGARATVTLSVRGTQVVGGYALSHVEGEPSPGLVEGLRALMGVLRHPA